MLADPSIAKVVFTPPALISLVLSTQAPCLALRDIECTLLHIDASSADTCTI